MRGRSRFRGLDVDVCGGCAHAVRDLGSVRYSRRQERRSRAILRLVRAEADRRDDLLHKASTAVANSAEVVATETLYLAGLLHNHRLARSLSEAALGRLVGMVRYKAERLGGLALAAPRFFPSSKRCAGCGTVNAALALGQRSWACPTCGAVLDRDGNAAENLHRLGLTAVADGPVPDDLRAGSGGSWTRAHPWRNGARTASGPTTPVGAACPEVTRGERVDRAACGREALVEPRTRTARLRRGWG